MESQGELPMKKFLLSGVAVAALLAVGPALAADMPVKAVPMAPPAWSWTGLYTGVHVGGGWGSTDYLDNSAVGFPPGGAIHQSPSGALGGTQTGARIQFGHAVFGLESKFSWADINSSVLSGPVPGETVTFRVNSLYTGTAEFGWAWDKWLLYAKGGYAGGSIEQNNNAPAVGAGPFQSSQSHHGNGWTAGAGIDYMWLQNLVVGIEYAHYDLSYGSGVSAESNGGVPYIQSGGRVKVDAIMARASIKSDWLSMLFR
jgi:outer membrane immunogenic protein